MWQRTSSCSRPAMGHQSQGAAEPNGAAAPFLFGAAVIVKTKGGYEVKSEGKPHKNLGGPYKTRAEAEKRLREVEYFKHAHKARRQ